MTRRGWGYSPRTYIAALLLIVCGAPTFAQDASKATVQWFQQKEQALMDAITTGDKQVWQQIMDEHCVVTSEEGEVIPKKEFLDELGPLPPGLSGTISVQDLTVQTASNIAIVRFLDDEHEDVFGQKLATQYRVTDTFMRMGSEWKMLASHISVVTKDPPPLDASSADWQSLVGTYQLVPNGWKFYVELRDGKLYGGRDAAKLKVLLPLTPDAFVAQGRLGEWLFVKDASGKAVRIVNFRKFEPLIWTRVG